MGQERVLCIGLANDMQLVSNVSITSVTCQMSHARVDWHRAMCWTDQVGTDRDSNA